MDRISNGRAPSRTSRLLCAAVLAAGLAGSAGAVALAQPYPYPPPGYVPVYEHWQPAWDRFEYDRHHVIVATVAQFQPYRLLVRRRDGELQMIDLKNGTVIRPYGATPEPGEQVAAIGYYSYGTFVANRIVLR